MIKIKRKRYIITRDNNTMILCGLSKNYHFKKISDIGNTSIKTYISKQKAIHSFECMWRNINFEYNVIEVTETLEENNKEEL